MIQIFKTSHLAQTIQYCGILLKKILQSSSKASLSWYKNVQNYIYTAYLVVSYITSLPQNSNEIHLFTVEIFFHPRFVRYPVYNNYIDVILTRLNRKLRLFLRKS